jgi:dynein heavy chain
MEPFEPIPGRPPRKVVVDRQRKLFASLDIEDLLLELVSNSFEFLSSHLI